MKVKQYRTRTYLLLLKAWLIYLSIAGLIIGIGRLVYNIPVGYFTKEAVTIFNGAFYVGALSNLGAIIWTVSATLCIFSFVYLGKYNSTSPLKMFFLHAGIYSTVLLLDDVYKLHDDILPYSLGIDDKPTYIIYLLFASYFVIRFKNIILQTEYVIFLASVVLLSLSVLMDQLDENFPSHLKNLFGFSEAGVLLEDTFKGLGILTWGIYFSRTVFKNVFIPIKGFDVTQKEIVKSFKKDTTRSF